MKAIKGFIVFFVALLMISVSAFHNTAYAASSQAESLISTAEGELGQTAQNGKTKYGIWYGNPTGAWCDMFVSWCAYTAGIGQDIIPKESVCANSRAFFQNQGRWHDRGSYTPVRGDIIFFQEGGRTSHIGIVESVDSRVHTIEGNSYDSSKGVYDVCHQSYQSTNTYIQGYGSPNYLSQSNAPSLSNPGNGVQISINTSTTFSWSNVGSRYHLVIKNPSGSSEDIFTNSTSRSYSPNVAGTWHWKVRCEADTSNAGPWSEERSFTVTDTSKPPAPSETYNVQYYKDAGHGTVGGAVSSESGLTSINKDWGTGGSPAGCTSNLFSAVFTGNVNFNAGWYDFRYTVDDSMKLWVGSECICDNDGQKDSPQPGGRYYNIKSTGSYPVRVEYVKCHAGTGLIRVSWTPVAPPMMTVTFDSQGGSSVPSQTVLCESTVARPADPARTGYAFGGWYKQAGCTEAFDFSKDKIGGNTTLYAKWTIKNYTVSFDSQGGSGVADISAPYNSLISAPGEPKRDGYAFAGWYTDYSYYYAWKFSSDRVTADIMLFAKWTSLVRPDLAPTDITYDGSNLQAGRQVSFDSGVRNDGNADADGFCIKWFVNGNQEGYGWHCGVPAGSTVMDDNSAFLWTPSAPGTYTVMFTVDSDSQIAESNEENNSVSVSVVIPEKTCAVTFDSQGGTDVASITAAYDTTITEPAAPTRTGYTFKGWYKEAACKNAWNFATDKVTDDITLYAKWTIKTYTVTFNSQGGTDVASLKATYNTTIAEPAAPTRTDYTFGGWYKEAACQNAWNFAADKVKANVTLYAKWTIKTYVVTFDSQGGTGVESAAVEAGSTVSAPADPIFYNYLFSSWYTEPECVSEWDFATDKVTGDMTLYAKWTRITPVYVDNVIDLIDNLKSNTIIALAPGEYDLSGDAGEMINNVTNLEVYCAGGGEALIYSTVPYGSVLHLYNSSFVSFSQITFGHRVPTGITCSAGVIDLYNCTNTWFSQCDVYGCGTIGFTFDQSSDADIIGCDIHDCIYGAADVFNSSDIWFMGCTIRANGNADTSYLFYIRESADVVLDGCTISGNGNASNPDQLMFNCDDAGSLWLFDCTVSDNHYVRTGGNCYLVSFNSQGGSAVAGKITGSGTAITQPPAPTRAGFTFGGWYKNSACTSAWRFAADRVTANITLYAKWTAKSIAAPTGVKAVAASYNSVKIVWNAMSGVTGYEISRASSSTGSYASAGTAASAVFVNSGLTTGRTYYYKVRAYIQSGSSKVYGAWSAAASAKPALAVPGSFKAQPLTYNSIKVTWGAVAGATKYELYRCTSKTGTYKLLATTSALGYTNTGVNTGTIYYYKVRAYRLVGSAKVYGNFTALVSTKTMLAVPSPVRAVRASASSIRVTWGKVAGATKYEIWRATSAAGTFSLAAATANAYYTNTGLKTGRTYYYKVRAYRLVGSTKVYSGFSVVVSARP